MDVKMTAAARAAVIGAGLRMAERELKQAIADAREAGLPAELAMSMVSSLKDIRKAHRDLEEMALIVEGEVGGEIQPRSGGSTDGKEDRDDDGEGEP